MSPSIQNNPFYQPARQWQIRVFARKAEVPAIEEAFTDLMLSSSSFEMNEDGDDWAVDVITDIPPEQADLSSRLALISGLLDIETPRCDVKLLEPKDWVSEVQQGFPPLHVGRFYVYGSHIATPPPHGKIALKVNAGAAFGSGEHATTSGCLKALGMLARHRSFRRPLDMGCGSGILAIAAAKLWHNPVLGIDIDPVSVIVARENARINQVERLTAFYACDGYQSRQVIHQAPFDLIVANILARPLVRMAPLLASNLSRNGMVILSGLLASQERLVLSAHRAQGLKLAFRIPIGGWNTLVLRRC